MTGSGQPAGSFRADVEGLRAVAVLLVVGDHLLGWPHGGYVGVDVFFVLSGFLITGLLVRELEATGRVDLRAFWGRRVRRLLPSALVVLAVTVVAAQLLFLPVRAAQTATDALFAAAFTANARAAALGTDYFSDTRPPSPVQHYWSLSVEEQFYAVWPLLLIGVALLAVRRGWRRGRALRLTVTAVLLLSLTWSAVETALSPTSAYFSTPVRAHELAVGALVALVAVRPGPATARVLGLLGLAAVLGSAVLLGPGSPFPGVLALVPVLGTAALLVAGRDGLPLPNRLLARPGPRAVGRVSYVLYLWHWPVVVLGAALVPDPSVLVLLGLLALAVALSVLTHVLVEEPLRRPRPRAAAAPAGRWRPRAAVLPAVLASCLLVVGTAAVLPRVLPEDPPAVAAGAVAPRVVELPDGDRAQAAPEGAFPTTAAAVAAVRAALAQEEFGELAPPLAALEEAGATEWVQDECLDVFPSEEARCVYGPADAPREAVLLGDSVGISLLPGLRAALEPAGYRVHVLTRRQCALEAPEDAVSPGCREHRERVLRRTAEIAPDLVLVSGSYVTGARPYTAADAPVWRERATAVLQRLQAPGRTVAVAAAPPQTGNLQSCATRLGSPQDCEREVDATWRALAAADEAAAAATGSAWLDPSGWLCADGRCPAVVDGTPVAFDGTHLTAASSRRLALLLRGVLLP